MPDLDIDIQTSKFSCDSLWIRNLTQMQKHRSGIQSAITNVIQKSVLDWQIWHNLWKTSEIQLSSLLCHSSKDFLVCQCISDGPGCCWWAQSLPPPDFSKTWEHWTKVHHKATSTCDYRDLENLLASSDCLSLLNYTVVTSVFCV